MNSSEFRDQLLEQESVTPELETRYRKRLKEMFEKPLGRGMRVLRVLGALIGVGIFLLFAAATIATFVVEKEPWSQFPIAERFMFAAGAVFGLVLAIYNFIIAKKGTVSLSLYRNKLYDRMTATSPGEAGLIWAFAAIVMVCSLMSANSMEAKAHSLNNEIQEIKMLLGGIKMVLSGMVFLVLVGIPLIIGAGQTRSELKVREEILRLEVHVAEISELLQRGK
jgi:hypothetical protein